MSNQYYVISFYKFFSSFDLSFRDEMKKNCLDHHLNGTVLLAHEGINASLEGLESDVDSFVNYLKSKPLFSDIVVKKSRSDGKAFRRLWVKIKKEIVALGKPEINPAMQMGYLVEPQDWDELINRPDVVTIDTRNAYEFEMGTFPSAVDPQTTTFRDFPKYIEDNREKLSGKIIAMFCTGGIRCEKASAYLLAEGFSEVYQLHGGILNYLENVPVEKNSWQGECMVFDHRWSLDKNLKQGVYRETHELIGWKRKEFNKC